MSLLPRRLTNRALLGVDINANAICMAALTHDNQKFWVQACARTPLAVANPNQEQITAALRQTLAATNIRVKSAAIAIDHSAALFKIIEVDASLTEDEIISHLHSRASQYFNQSSEELLLDFETLGPSKNHPALRVIRWIAAKKQPITNYIESLKHVGLTTTIVDINSYALQRAAHYCFHKTSTIPSVIAVVYINGESVLFTVSDHQIPVYTLAEQNKSPQHGVDATSSLLTFIMRALQLYYNSEPHKPITQLTLCGHIADPGIINTIQQHTGISTELSVPFDCPGFQFAEKKQSASLPNNRLSQYHAPEFMLSIGLAMRIGRSL